MNVNKTIKDLRGNEYPKSLPSEKEREEAKGDFNKLPKETVGNIIINCLASYRGTDKRDGFYINSIAQSVLNPTDETGKVELKDKLNKFLIDVLGEMTLIKVVKEVVAKDGTKTKEDKLEGLYASWVISQVLIELGVKEEE